MDSDERSFDFSAIFSRLNLPIVVFFAGLFVLALGAGFVIFKSDGKSDIQVLSAEESPVVSKIVVDVGGAVKFPGVYKVDSGARVADAVTAAGGLTEDANRTSINLAAKISDGQKIIVAAKSDTGTNQGAGAGGQIQGASLINVNNASAEELDGLPQVGPATAQKIIAGRPYSGPDDLIAKKAITRAVLEKIKDRISF